jgi:CHAT domain-containing protein
MNKSLIFFFVLLFFFKSSSQTNLSWENHISNGDEYFASQNYPNAISEYQKAYTISQEIFTDANEKLEKNLFFLGKASLLNEDYKNAIKWYKLNLDFNKDILNQNLANKIIILNDIGFSYASLERYEEAIKYYQSSLSLTTDSRFDPTQKFLLLANLATSYDKISKFNRSLAIYREINLLINNHSDKFTTGDLLKNESKVAQTLYNLKKYGAASKKYKSISEKFKNDLDLKSRIYILNDISNSVLREKKISEAFKYKLQALELAKKEFSNKVYWEYLEESFDQASGLDHIPTMSKIAHMGRIFQDSNPEAKQFITHSFYLNQLGLYMITNEYESAFIVYEKALELVKRRYGDSQPELVEVIKAREGDIYRKMGVYTASNQAYLTFINFFESSPSLNNFGNYRELYLDYLIKLSENFKYIGRQEEAKIFLHRAIKKTNLDFKKINPIQFHFLRGKINYELGNYLQAKKDFESVANYNHFSFNFYENQLGIIKSTFKLGNHSEASKLYDTLSKNLSDQDFQFKRFKIKEELGDLFFEGGDFKNALEFYKKTYEAFKDPLTDAELLKKILFTHSNLDDNNATYKIMEQYFTYKEKLIEKSYFLLGPKEQDAYFDEIKRDLGLFQVLVFHKKWNNPFFNNLLFNTSIKFKGVLVRARIEMINHFFKTENSQIVDRINSLYEVRQLYSNTNYIKSINNTIKNSNIYETTENKEFRILFSLFADIYPEKKLLDYDLEKNLEFITGNDILLEFSSFEFFNEKKEKDRKYLVYVMKKAWPSPRVFYLFNENDIISKISGEGNISYATRGASGKSIKPKQELNLLLYSKIFKPIEEFVTPGDRIYFSLNGILNTIPFSAFKKTKDSSPIIQDYVLIQVKDIGRLYKIKSPSNESINLLGGCLYGYDNTNKNLYDFNFEIANYWVSEGIIAKESYSGASFYHKFDNPTNIKDLESIDEKTDLEKYYNTDTWNYLDGTAREVDSISKIFREKNLNVQVFSGINATEEVIKKFHNKSPKVIHIATHGFFNPDNTYFETTNQKFESKDYSSYDFINSNLVHVDYSFERSMTSLNNSGLILSKGDYAWSNGLNPYEKEDGILTAKEISYLNLSNTDLVVLSACETGLGKVTAGEGIYGLQMAFRMAGVENLIMSLWEVPDIETEEFMSTFYSKWIKGITAREAFQETQREMAMKYTGSPEKWSAFIMVQ